MCCGGIFKWFLKLSAFIAVKSHRLHLFCFSPLWAFKCGLKLAAWINLKSHWLHLFDLAPLCALKCLLKSPAWIHIGCVWFFSTMYFQMCPQLLTALTDHKKSIFTLQADPEKSRDFIFQNPGILINWKSRDSRDPARAWSLEVESLHICRRATLSTDDMRMMIKIVSIYVHVQTSHHYLKYVATLVWICKNVLMPPSSTQLLHYCALHSTWDKCYNLTHLTPDLIK